MFVLNCLIYLIFILVSCNGELKTYGKGKYENENHVILPLNQLKEEDEYEISYEGADHSDYLIFQYNGVSGWFRKFCKLWSSVEVTIHSDDDKFKMRIADTIAELRQNSDASHEHDTFVERLQDISKDITDVIQHGLDALSHFIFYHDDKSVKLNPIGQHFVRLCYRGSKPDTVFSVTVNDAIDWKFPFYFLTGGVILTFVHPISRKVNLLYILCAIPVGIICSPYTVVYMFSRLFPWIFVSYGVCFMGFASVTFMLYNLTLEEIFQLPLIYILCGAVFIELFFYPVTKFVNTSQRLMGYEKFLWPLRFGAAILLVLSTQSWEASAVLLTITWVIHVSLLQKNKKLNSRKKKLSSQELEYVTITNNN